MIKYPEDYPRTINKRMDNKKLLQWKDLMIKSVGILPLGSIPN